MMYWSVFEHLCKSNASMVTISSFDSEIDATIVKRGHEYFRKGRVRDFEEQDEGVFAALIEGTEVYETTIELSGDVLRKHHCTCPYDLGEYCKHEVAMSSFASIH
jgi:uncharacterized Zn finger protein